MSEQCKTEDDCDYPAWCRGKDTCRKVGSSAAPCSPVFGPYQPQDWPEDHSHENGDYQNECVYCERQFLGHKRRVVCKLCSEAKRLSSATSGAQLDSNDLFSDELPKDYDYTNH